MKKTMKWQMIGQSDPGSSRQKNEDAIATNTSLGIAILADGMGGHNAGEVASTTVVQGTLKGIEDAIENSSEPLTVELACRHLKSVISIQNNELFNLSSSIEAYSGMGCTLVVVWLIGVNAVIANVGDSRCYHFHDGALTQITHDHSFLQFQLDHGLISQDEINSGQTKNHLLRAVGTASKINPDFFDVNISKGDLLLLCSDGLTECLSNSDIQSIVAKTESLEDLPDQLIQAAIQSGSRDNISVQVIGIDSQESTFVKSDDVSSKHGLGFLRRIFK